jgi:hypothetical protein
MLGEPTWSCKNLTGNYWGSHLFSILTGGNHMSEIAKDLTLEQRLARVEAYIEIQNVMSSYAYFHSANRHQESAELFALDTEDAWSEMTWGRYNGKEGIMRLYKGFHTFTDGDRVGKMHIHTLCHPMIEVAADCKTARAIWVSPGLETDSFTKGTPEAFWCWIKYDCDFIIEKGRWKIWHMRTPGIIMTPYDTPWTKPVFNTMGGPPMPEEYYPDEPPVGPNWEYSPDKVYPYNDPEQPAPYRTWSDLKLANRDNTKSKPVTPLARKR